MKNKELIRLLNMFDPELEVIMDAEGVTHEITDVDSETDHFGTRLVITDYPSR